MRARSIDAIDGAATALLFPADALRRATYRTFGRALAPMLRDRGLRVAVFGSIAVCANFLLACSHPWLLLLVGPLVLGVPHLLADVRYLVVRPGFVQRPALLAAILVPSLVGFFAPTVAVAAAALAGAALATRGSIVRRAVVAAVAVGCAAISHAFGSLADVAFAHAHNLVGFVWLFVLGDRDARRAIPLGVTVLGAAAILVADVVPAPDVLPERVGFAGASLWELRASLAPGVGAALGTRVVLLFAFLQAVHYAVWLRLVPEVGREREAPRSFVSSFRALRADFGMPFLAMTGLVATVILGTACVAAGEARDSYLRLALFHGPLELAVLGAYFVEGGGPWRRS